MAIETANTYAAIIPARAGSKRLPHKNTRPLLGKPLIAHTIRAALEAELIDEVWVTTDDPKVIEIAEAMECQTIHRPSHLAGDRSKSSDVTCHALTELEAKGIKTSHALLLQPTSPLRNADHIERCLKAFEQSGARSCMSVTDIDHHPYKQFVSENGVLKPLFGREHMEAPHQSLPEVLRQNGAIYVFRWDDMFTEKSFYIDPVFPFFMDPEDSIDIDNQRDIDAAEFLIGQKNKPNG